MNGINNNMQVGRDEGEGSLGHVHAADAVAMDAVVESRVLQGRVRFQLLHYITRLLSKPPLT